MRLTILSHNLPDQSVEGFSHEFHTVHAKVTHDVAIHDNTLEPEAGSIRTANQIRLLGQLRPRDVDRSSLQ
jgi:hypothetical protein